MTGSQGRAEALTDREIDFLFAIESLAKGGWPARIVDIARLRGVSAPSAIEMVGRLRTRSVVEKGPGGIKVSSRGEKILSEIRRSHRILETILTRMGMNPDTACSESKSIDRHLSRGVTQTICAYLDHPKTCPDAMPIEPDPECCVV